MKKDLLLNIALAEVGYLEKNSAKNLDDKTANAGDGNYTKYWRDLKSSYQGQPWCNAFVNWCFYKAYADYAKRMLFTDGDWSYYTPTSASYFKNNGRWYAEPLVGDLIYFKNDVRIHHVGIVYKVDAKNVYTIEGNTSNGTYVIANGGAVCQKVYSLKNNSIAGYGRPNWGINNDKYHVGWKHDERGWWYADTPNTYVHDRFMIINGCRYYFDHEGYAVTGMHTIDGKVYAFCNEPNAPKECAEMQTGPDGSLMVRYYA